MKKNEKNKPKNNEKIKKETEKIKEIIRKETGIYIKKMNSRNLKKEFERFYYIMASNLCRFFCVGKLGSVLFLHFLLCNIFVTKK